MKNLAIQLFTALLLAATSVAQAQLTYITNGSAITITGYSASGPGAVTIPATTNGLTVTAIQSAAFSLLSNVTSVSIPASVTNIGGDVFYDCTNLTAITVDPNNLLYSSVNGALFDKHQVTLLCIPGGKTGAYAIPGTVSTIEEDATVFCAGLTSVTIPGGITTIYNELFYECFNLKSVVIPGTISNLPAGSFAYCSNLAGVYFQGNAPAAVGDPPFVPTPFQNDASATAYYLPGTTGWSTNYAAGIPAVPLTATPASQFSFTTNGAAISIAGYPGTNGIIVIPATINGLPVTSIAGNAFYSNTNLVSVAFPASLTNIGTAAFELCVDLTNVVMLPGLINIGASAFSDCVNLPGVVIPNSVTTIGASAFASCFNLASLVLPNNLTNIGSSAFFVCFDLTSVTIPAGVTSIGSNAFGSIPNLASAYFYGNPPPANSTVFGADNAPTIYYFPCATGWSASYDGLPALPQTPANEFSYSTSNGCTVLLGYSGSCGILYPPTTIEGFPVAYIESPSGTQTPFASGNTNLTSVTIPSCVNSIGQEAFSDCSNLRTVTIQQGVISASNNVFSGCSRLTNISIPPSLVNIGNFLLDGDDLAALPGGIADLGEGEFQGNPLTNITIPNVITSIPDYTFCVCSLLTNAVIPGSVGSIGQFAFYGDPLTGVILPNGVTNIGSSAYYQCSRLTNVVIPASVTHMGGDAFGYCPVLTNILFLGNAPGYGGGAQTGPVFDTDTNATVYYLPGATGWSSNFNGTPAVLWNPQIQTNAVNFGVRTNHFGFNITGTANIPILVEACTNLTTQLWTPVTNVSLTNGSFFFSETYQSNIVSRYYRITFP